MKFDLHHDIRGELDSPTFLAGWPGMGNVGATAIGYLRADLKAELLGEIDVSELVAPEAIVIKEGLAELPGPPASPIYYLKHPPLLILESEVQVGGTAALELMKDILDFAQDHETATIITGAAFAMPVGRAEPVKVFGAANEKALRDRLPPAGVELLQEGQITGLNGLLLGFAGLREIPAACLLATMPQYAINIVNPKSSKEIIRVLERILGVEIDMTALDEAIAQTDKLMEQIENHIRKAFHAGERPGEEEGEDWKEVEEEKVPQYVMEKIERLFSEVKATASKEKAAQLKQELDRWDLYKLYEDRFLNLFRETDEK